MLTFFRRIRKGLLDMGAARKYLLYAVGEIALVVIGILIALQINNWNEWRKDRKKEIEILLDIRETLELNDKILSEYIGLINTSNQSTEIIISVIENNSKYADSLDYHFMKAFSQWSQGFVSQGGYEGLKNGGLNIVQSDNLRKEIVNLFENTYPIMRENIKQWQMDQNILKYMDENFIWLGDRVSPFDFNSVKNDYYFYSVMHRLFGQRNWFRGFHKEALKETRRVLQLIDDEFNESGYFLPIL